VKVHVEVQPFGDESDRLELSDNAN